MCPTSLTGPALYIVVAGMCVAMMGGCVPHAHAEEEYRILPIAEHGTRRYSNENWYTLPHPRAATLTVHDDGSMSGLTEDGIPFLQYAIPNPYDVRVHRFEIQDHYHYIVGGKIADSFTEFSVLLAQTYREHVSG